MIRLDVLWCWLKGTHGREIDGWGYATGSGMINLYCDFCGARFATIPLEDFEGMEEVLDLIHDP